MGQSILTGGDFRCSPRECQPSERLNIATERVEHGHIREATGSGPGWGDEYTFEDTNGSSALSAELHELLSSIVRLNIVVDGCWCPLLAFIGLGLSVCGEGL